MKRFEIWCEGYAINGECFPAIYLGNYEGETFDDAVELYKKNNPGKVITGELAVNTKEKNSKKILVKLHTIWCSRLFDNEVDARKTFG